MEIIIHDTLSLYKTLLTLPEEQRMNYYNAEIIKPFVPAFQIMQMPMTPEALGCMPLTGKDTEIKEMLTRLENANVLANARDTLVQAAQRMEAADIRVPETIIAGIFIGDPDMLAFSRGYTGLGSIPGYLQIVIAPNDYNLPRLNACIAHEFHHNVYFFNSKWNFMEVTLGKYLAVEGLAENFATNMFGENLAGPWVSEISDEDLEKTRIIIGKNLDTKGFMEVRKYMYGNHPMVPDAKGLGIPYCGGYAVGYQAVKYFLRKTGASIEDATKMDGDELMKSSGYFS